MAIACDMIIFDCDGVLVDSEVLSVAAMHQVLVDAGVPVTAAMIASCFGMKTADILLRIASETGSDIPPGVTDRLWPATRILFERSLKPMPGVAAFLGQLDGTKVCVASSSSPERIRASLAMTDLDRFFGEDIFSSSQVQRGKPAPDLFLFAASSMNVEPGRCLVIEDSIFGVRGARAAGMTALGFSGGSHIQAGYAATLLAGGAAAVEPTYEALAPHVFA